VALLAGACTPLDHYPYVAIVDQRNFHGATVAPTADTVTKLPERALVVIRFDGQPTDYEPDLTDAVAAATARKPDVQFDVIVPLATGARATPQQEHDAAAVARAIAEQAVQPDHIHLGLIEEAGNPAREVRVFVR
jgi:hypothetical protein